MKGGFEYGRKITLKNSDWSDIRDSLLQWGQTNFRDFPWRNSKNSYSILVAEIMLHRTQVNQVLPVYEHFINRFPTLAHLYRTSKSEIRNLFAPLGLAWRTERFIEMLDVLDVRFSRTVPVTKNDLLSLPGVSEYIASAVMCFRWESPEVLVDTNTVRIAGRFFGIETSPSTRRKKGIRGLLGHFLDVCKPAATNYALLDLGYLVCTGKKLPKCQICPLNAHCITGRKALLSV